MKVNYKYCSGFDTYADKVEKDIESFAGKLLETVGAHTLIVCVDNDDKPVVYAVDGRMDNAFDFACNNYLDKHGAE